MEWIAIDFETANGQRDSACSLGMAIVNNGEIIKRHHWLIKPPDMDFNPYNTAIHGITPEDVVNKPRFDELWPDLKPLLQNKTVVAHNASFDFSVLRHTLDRYQISYPELTYYCTRIFSKHLWPEFISHGLSIITHHLDIDFQHHNAEEDAWACAKLSLACCQKAEARDLLDLSKKLRAQAGELYVGGYSPASEGRHTERKVPEVLLGQGEINPDNPFYDKRVVFTGTLSSLTRSEAKQLVKSQGGTSPGTVSAVTNFLVVGDQDLYKLKDGKKSTKMKKAEILHADGNDIEIIGEKEFLELLVV